MIDDATAFSDDAFLGGKLRLLQPLKGFRAGLDAVMLAAAIPARSGETTLEAGLGNGAASLCVLGRVAGITATGVEIDADAVALAQQNALRNGFANRLIALAGDVEASGKAADDQFAAGGFDHVFANPPYHRSDSSSVPKDATRARAHQRGSDSLERWVRFLLHGAKSGGSLTLILPASVLDEALGVLSGRIGDLALFPLFPRPGEPARRIILQGRKGSKGPLRLLPGLLLHGEGQGFSADAEAILREGAALNL